MACPYFYPGETLAARGKHPRMPLGDPYAGVCRVDPLREWRPDDDTLARACNLGYARKTCPRFPKGSGADAFRFSVAADEDGVLKIFFVCERNHSALEHGTLDFSVSHSKFVNRHTNDLLMRQAEAYIESYLRRKSHPEALARNPHRR